MCSATLCYCSYRGNVSTYRRPALNGVTEALPPATRRNQKTCGSNINRALHFFHLPVYSKKIFIDLVIVPRCHHERHYLSRKSECNAVEVFWLFDSFTVNPNIYECVKYVEVENLYEMTA